MLYPKITLVQIPRTDPAPSLGLTLLRDNLQQGGVDCDIFDANLDLYQRLAHDQCWQHIEMWGIQQQRFDQLELHTRDLIRQALQAWIYHIRDQGSELVGVSVFTTESRNWAEMFCYYLRRYLPGVKILLGGRGLSLPGSATADFAEKMLAWDLCDFYLNGESENEIVELARGTSHCVNQGPGKFIINEHLERNSSLVLGTALNQQYQIQSNWYDVNDAWMSPNVSRGELKPKLKTEATRGCVKRCTFCDVHLVRSKFTMRDPRNLVDEIKCAVEDDHVRKVVFSDDMINGSNRHFITWLELLDRYLTDNKIADFQWESQFGLKHHRSTPDDIFPLMHRTGACLNVGVDHFSDPVLAHMQKLYTNHDIYHYLERWTQYPIRLRCLLISAYPTETDLDHSRQVQGVRSLGRYRSFITSVDLGNTCTIPVGSALERLPDMQFHTSRLDWYWPQNPTLTAEVKMQRRRELDQVLEEIDINNRKQRTHWARMLNANLHQS